MTQVTTSGSGVVRFQDQDPLTIIPHGDRLLVEVLAVNETTDSGIIVVRDEKNKEHDLGWSAGVVISVGNGHRLDTPDQAVVIQSKMEQDGTDEAGNAKYKAHEYIRLADTETGSSVAMIPSTVPMPFARGMVVMCARYAGSDIQLQGKPYKIITQAHVIAVFSGIRVNVGDDQPIIKRATVPCGDTSGSDNMANEGGIPPDFSIAIDQAAKHMNADSVEALTAVYSNDD